MPPAETAIAYLLWVKEREGSRPCGHGASLSLSVRGSYDYPPQRVASGARLLVRGVLVIRLDEDGSEPHALARATQSKREGQDLKHDLSHALSNVDDADVLGSNTSSMVQVGRDDTVVGTTGGRE